MIMLRKMIEQRRSNTFGGITISEKKNKKARQFQRLKRVEPTVALKYDHSIGLFKGCACAIYLHTESAHNTPHHHNLIVSTWFARKSC